MSTVDYPALGALPPETAGFLAGLPVQLNLFNMTAHSPPLVAPVVELGATILTSLELSARHREMLILHTGATTGCRYEVEQHRAPALAAGLGRAGVDALCAGTVPPGITALDRDVLLAGTQLLLGTPTIAADLRDRLGRTLGIRQVAEMCYVVGYYRMLAGFLRCLEVEIDAQGEQLQDATTRYRRTR